MVTMRRYVLWRSVVHIAAGEHVCEGPEKDRLEGVHGVGLEDCGAQHLADRGCDEHSLERALDRSERTRAAIRRDSEEGLAAWSRGTGLHLWQAVSGFRSKFYLRCVQ